MHSLDETLRDEAALRAALALAEVRYIQQALREMIENGHATLEVRQNVHDDYNRLVDETCRNMVWSHPGVTSWYKNRHNRVTVT